MVSPAQMRMARSALKIGVRELAVEAGVTTATITRYENERGGLQANTRDKLQATLERLGIQFIPENGGGAGVRLAKPTEVFDQ